MKLLFTTFFLLFSSLVHASPITEKIQLFYEKIPAFSADFTQMLEHRESGAKETRKGTLKLKKPFNVRWQTETPTPESIIINNQEVWNYLPDEEIAYRYSPAIVQDSRNIIQVLSGQGSLEKEFDVQDKGKDGNLRKLLLFPHEPTTQLVEATLWINDRTGQIVRARILDFYGNANDVTLNNFKSADNFQTSVFEFKPPEGVDIEDRTRETGRDIFN